MRFAFGLLVGLVSVWSATDVSFAWMERLQRAMRRAGVTPKAMRITMQLTERQIYDQLGLKQPMQAPRLEEVFAEYPEMHVEYCRDVLEAYGYRVYREAWLLAMVDALCEDRKRMASMTLPQMAAGKVSA